jgi:hypothetical protein
VEAFALPTSGGTYAGEIERLCHENELVISTWSPIHLRSKLRDLYWKETTVAVRAAAFWEDMQRYLFLPRLKHRSVLEQAIMKGAGSKDFFGTAYGQNGDQLEGFKLGDANVELDDTLLLVEPTAAAAYEATRKKSERPPVVDQGAGGQTGQVGTATAVGGRAGGVKPGHGVGDQGTLGFPAGPPVARAGAFFGSVEVSATTAKMKLVSIAEEIIAVLAADPNATVRVTLEIVAEFPAGASDQTRRAVSENASLLGFKSKTWE